jgi:hypothetical protein
MAEIEPGGVTAAPVETSPVETTSFATAPVTGGAVGTAAPPASRPKGLARWGVALLAVAVMIGVVSVAAAVLAAGGGASSVEKWLPKGTIAYLEMRADLPGDQRAKVGDLLAKFPGFADQSSLDAKIDEALERLLDSSGVSWTTDVKPWLGGEIGLAATTAVFDVAHASGSASPLDGGKLASAPDDGVVLLVGVKDGAAATAWISKQLGGTPKIETYDGGEIAVVEGPLGTSMAYAVRGTVLLAGPEKAVKAALDTKGSSPVATSDPFAAAKKTAPNAYLAYGYVDLKAVVDASLAMAGDQAGLSAACLDQAVGMIPDWAAGSAWAQDGALVLEASSPATGDGAADAKDSTSGIASHLPPTTVAAIEVRDFGPALVAGLESLKKQLACDPSTAAVVDQIEQGLAAVGGAESLVGWAGDTAIAVEFNGGTPGGGLAAIVTNDAAAGRALDQVQALVALGGAGAGITSRQEAYGNGELLVVTIPSGTVGGDVPEIAATVQGGVFVLGTIDFVKDVIDTSAGSSLATADAYERAISLAGGAGVSDVFVDIAGIRAAVETMIPAAEKSRYETEVKPFLVPFEAFASVSEAPASTTTARAVITFTK